MMPPQCTMVWWRFKGVVAPWRFGYVTYERGHNLVRMGAWNGDTMNGSVVDADEIEWRHRNS